MAFCLSLGLKAQAQAPLLALPIDCEPGITCWIPNHVDMNPGSGVKDYACGPNTYNGHKGTDFAITNLKIMRQGVDVLAAARGIVKSVRDEMPDVNFRWLDRKRLKGKECGNGVVISHEKGWESQYCHLREGSISVQKGQRVAPGDKLGLVGLSGLTEFPHLHLSLRYNGEVIDPFNRSGEKCGTTVISLWRPEVRPKLLYQRSAIYNIGFSSKRPTRHKTRLGLYDTKIITGPVEILFVVMEIFGAEPNDNIFVRISNGEGNTITKRRIPLEIATRKARIFRWIGFRQKDRLWRPGTFKADIEVLRKGSSGTSSFSGSQAITIN